MQVLRRVDNADRTSHVAATAPGPILLAVLPAETLSGQARWRTYGRNAFRRSSLRTERVSFKHQVSALAQVSGLRKDKITVFEAVWLSIATPVLLQNGTLIGATVGQNSFRMLDGFGTKRRKSSQQSSSAFLWADGGQC